MKVYFDTRDMWVGLYRDTGKGIRYLCPLPCLVIRWRKRRPAAGSPGCHLDRGSDWPSAL